MMWRGCILVCVRPLHMSSVYSICCCCGFFSFFFFRFFNSIYILYQFHSTDVWTLNIEIYDEWKPCRTYCKCKAVKNRETAPIKSLGALHYDFNVLKTISYMKSSIHCMQTIRFAECSSRINNNEAEVQLMFRSVLLCNINCAMCIHTHTTTPKACAAIRVKREYIYALLSHSAPNCSRRPPYFILCAMTERKLTRLQIPANAHTLTNAEKASILIFPVCHPTSPNSATWIWLHIYVWYWLHNFRAMKNIEYFHR